MRLSAEQRRITEHLEGGLLVLAPVGSGKTTVLTERLGNVMLAAFPPERVLCLTFTNRAVRAIRGRLVERYPDHARRLTLRTFHHMCADILRREAKAAGLAVDFTVCDEADSVALLKRILREEDDRGEAAGLYHRLQELKARARVEGLGWPIDHRMLCGGLKEPRWRDAAERYQRGLRQWQTLDFGDLVLTVRALFAMDVEARDRWAGRYDMVQLDEAQDTHASEFDVVHALAERSGNLALFGDRDQTIYEWRGSDPRVVLTRFEAGFAPVTQLSLTHNYRATRHLHAVASAFADSFEHRTLVVSPDSAPAGRPASFHVARDVGAEAHWVGRQIRRLARREPDFTYRGVGVLAPTNWQCAEVARALEGLGVPHVTTERTQFFRGPEIKDLLAYLRLLLNPNDTGAALRVWEQSTRQLGPGTLTRVRAAGEPIGLRLVDLLRQETFEDGDPLGPVLGAYRRGRLVVLDVESTGLSSRDEVVEIAAQRLEAGRPTGSFHAYLRNGVAVGTSRRVHGLDDAFLAAHGRPAAEAFDAFFAFRGDDLLVGHNVGFDLELIAAHARRLGRHVPPPRVADTLHLAERFVRADRFTLEALSAQLGQAHRPAHRAAADVLATCELLGTLVARAEADAPRRRELVVREGGPFRPLADRLASWRMAARELRPAALAARVVEDSGLAERYAREPRRRRSFDELVRVFERHDDADLDPMVALREAVAYAALAGSIDQHDETEDRVSVITIHQSKGLEFETVFVVGLAEGDLPRRRAVEAGRLEEERRLFYVALTRASRRLYISAPAYHADRPRERSQFLTPLDGHLVPSP